MFAEMTSKDLETWGALANGRPALIEKNVAYCGNWRTRLRSGDRVPVLVRKREDGVLVAQVFPSVDWVVADAEWAERVFAWAVRDPITQETLDHYMAEGEWPDDVKAPELNRNLSPDQQIREAVADLLAEMKAYLKDKATIGRHEADKVGNFKSRFADLEKEAEEARVSAKKPYLAASRHVDKTWQPVIKAAKDAKNKAAGIVRDFLLAERAKALQKAAEIAAAGQAVNGNPASVKAGTWGRGVHLRTFTEVRFDDYKAVVAHYRDDDRVWNNPDLIALLSQLVRSDFSSGKAVPGAHLESVERAV